jgi:hypothetical protein
MRQAAEMVVWRDVRVMYAAEDAGELQIACQIACQQRIALV